MAEVLEVNNPAEKPLAETLEVNNPAEEPLAEAFEVNNHNQSCRKTKFQLDLLALSKNHDYVSA
ncbi:MAG: hypothetical protein Crog4KO_00250 [Crocinitomicaceae bacterium]